MVSSSFSTSVVWATSLLPLTGPLNKAKTTFSLVFWLIFFHIKCVCLLRSACVLLFVYLHSENFPMSKCSTFAFVQCILTYFLTLFSKQCKVLTLNCTYGWFSPKQRKPEMAAPPCWHAEMFTDWASLSIRWSCESFWRTTELPAIFRPGRAPVAISAFKGRQGFLLVSLNKSRIHFLFKKGQDQTCSCYHLALGFIVCIEVTSVCTVSFKRS